MSVLSRAVRSRARRMIRAIGWRYREATWRSRPLPTIIVIGAQKAGTSSLFAYMSQHPQLSPSCKKEVHFFDGGKDASFDAYELGQRWYRAHFSSAGPGASCKAFEASPNYLLNPLAPERMFGLLPEARLIVLLRNPTERAISHYFHNKREGHEEPLPIGEAMQREEERLAPAIEHRDYKSAAFRQYSYKYRGLYRERLEGFLKVFPRTQLLILNSERFFAEPADALRRVFGFAGVDEEFTVRDLRPRNVGSRKEDVPSGVYEYLNDFFRLHNRALYDLVGEDYGW